MIDAKELISGYGLTEDEIKDLIDNLTNELRSTRQERYNKKVEQVRELLKEMAEEYPDELAIEEDGIRVERDIDWSELEFLFIDTEHTLFR